MAAWSTHILAYNVIFTCCCVSFGKRDSPFNLILISETMVIGSGVSKILHKGVLTLVRFVVCSMIVAGTLLLKKLNWGA